MSEHSPKSRFLIKKCHICGHLNEGEKEMKRCAKCRRSFFPLNYFAKIDDGTSKNSSHLFCRCDELREEDVIKGLYVLW
ncbi:MAG: hypothetical protein OXB88_08595 [Bacteriovoracales bacterium]|nr:hypothetical protein [Bacteriovoracales bacterium]